MRPLSAAADYFSAMATREPASLFAGRRPLPAHIAVYVFVVVPFLALVAAVPFAWGWGLTWVDVVLAACWYTFTCLGVTVGFHRYFTHSSFKTGRRLRIALAVVGSLAMQGPILHWVADHRRHHAFSDKEGDPHSPWLFGTSPAALARLIWLFEKTGLAYDVRWPTPRRLARITAT